MRHTSPGERGVVSGLVFKCRSEMTIATALAECQAGASPNLLLMLKLSCFLWWDYSAHPPEDELLAPKETSGRVRRTEQTWVDDRGGEQGGLLRRELSRGLPEIRPRRRLHPVDA